MSYRPFYERFPELAWKETRSITILPGHPFLPADEYGLLELYCADKNCDCRRVFFNVVSRKQQTIVAVVTFGWEDESYYRQWFGGENDETTDLAVNEMAGVGLNPTSSQSPIAPALLETIRQILRDTAYVERIKRHYQMYKELVDPRHFGKTRMTKSTDGVRPKSRKRK